jgi:hypothetical protein
MEADRLCSSDALANAKGYSSESLSLVRFLVFGFPSLIRLG